MNLRILVVDDEKLSRITRTRQLLEAGYQAEAHESAFTALASLEAQPWDVVLTDLRMPSMDGLAFLKEIQTRSPHSAVILMTAFGTVKTAVEAMRAGAVDFLTKPFDFDELKIRLERIAETQKLRREVAELRKVLGTGLNFSGLVGQSQAMRRVYELIEQFADSASNVLVVGETGTGKELVARALHARSPVAKGPFVPVACGAVPRELAESELLGHEAGAFTGATRTRKGRVELAHGGTLFLDDVDDLPLELQPKLLRVIQERQFERVGSEKTIRVEVRIISATKADLQELVRKDRFRQDLLYRLQVLVLQLPPLRERKEDILLLAKHFVDALSLERGGKSKTFSESAVQALVAYSWPGNVRELRHAVEHAFAVSKTTEIQPEDLPLGTRTAARDKLYSLNLENQTQIDFRAVVGGVEQELIRWALTKSRGNQGKAAELLSLPRTTLVNKLGPG